MKEQVRLVIMNVERIQLTDQVRMNVARIPEEWLKIVLQKEQLRKLREFNKIINQKMPKEVKLPAENLKEILVITKIQEAMLQEEIKNYLNYYEKKKRCNIATLFFVFP
jgi:hypothetical protein